MIWMEFITQINFLIHGSFPELPTKIVYIKKKNINHQDLGFKDRVSTAD